jgi:hypothetical protein
MDIETIDRNYEELKGQGQQTVRALAALAEKLQRAAEAGDLNAREWLLDLKEVALEIRSEQTQVGQLLQSLHGFVADHLQSPPPYDRQPYDRQQQYPAPQQYQQPYPQQPYPQQPQPYAPPQYAQQPYPQQGYPAQGGGMLGRFMGSNFGQAVTMGAGLAIGEDLIDDLFG